MRILVETDAGALVEVRKLETVQNADLLLAFGGSFMSEESISILEEQLSTKTGKRVVVIPPSIHKIVGI